MPPSPINYTSTSIFLTFAIEKSGILWFLSMRIIFELGKTFIMLEQHVLLIKRIGTPKVQMSRWYDDLAPLQQWRCYLQGPGFESHL